MKREKNQQFPLINKYVIKSKEITEVIVDITITHKFLVIMEQFTLPTGEIIKIPSILNIFEFKKIIIFSKNTI